MKTNDNKFEKYTYILKMVRLKVGKVSESYNNRRILLQLIELKVNNGVKLTKYNKLL